MSEIKINIAAAEGDAEGFLYTPQDDGRSSRGEWPGVLFLTDIFGIRPENQGMAAHIADRGYAVLMPNIFYRTDKLPIMTFAFQIGETRSMRRLSHLLSAVDADRMARDGAAYVNYLLERPEVCGNKVAVVGYCFTGQMALRTAAATPNRVAAAASFHGGGLVTDKPGSPHTILPKVKAELYFGHAVEDQSMPPDAIEKLDDALKAWGGSYASEVYEGAKHGWSVPGRPVYNPAQSERHYEKLFDLLQRTLS